MPSPYPIELRTRVLEKIETGMENSGRKYDNLHRETIANWIKIKEENGRYESRKDIRKDIRRK